MYRTQHIPSRGSPGRVKAGKSHEYHHQQPMESRTCLRKKLGDNCKASFGLRRFVCSFKAGICVLLGVILTTPTNTFISHGSGLGMGVAAAPCSSEDSHTTAAVGEPQLVIVTSVFKLNMTTMFACEDGNFEVLWSGTVHVPGTIVIGNRTTVKMSGDSATSNSADYATSSGVRSKGHGIRNSSVEHPLQQLVSGLLLPSGLTSEVVGVGPPDESEPTNKDSISGPIFLVDGGNLILEDLIIRDGYTTDYDHSNGANGAGIIAVGAHVNVSRCEFSNNFAAHWGGGIYAEGSTLIVADSLFEGCTAGFQSYAGEEDVIGAGGGIAVRTCTCGMR